MTLDITLNNSPYNATSGSDIGPPWRLARTDGEAASGQVTFRLNNGTYPLNSKDTGLEWTELAGNIRNLLVQGQSMAGTKIERGSNGFITTSQCGQVAAIPSAPNWSARIKHVALGSTSLECVTHAHASRFSSFLGPAWLTSFDIQGAGNPSSCHWWENVIITAANASTGIITIASPTRYEHLDTWPCVNPGDNTNADAGGPATLFIMDYLGLGRYNYDLVEFRDLQLNDPGFAGGGIYITGRGKNIIYRRVKSTNPDGLIPSENGTVSFIDCDFSAVSPSIEVDKCIDLIRVSGGTHGGMDFQSASAIELRIEAGAVVTRVNGTPKRLTLNNATIGELTLGARAYGSSDSFYSTNGILTAFGTDIFEGGAKDTGGWINAEGVNNSYRMLSDGTIVIPRQQQITAYANQGGIFRVTVGSTSPFTTGKWYAVGLGVSNPGDIINGGSRVTVVNGTQLDLLDVAYVSGATIGNIGVFMVGTWAVPGTNCFWWDKISNNRIMGKFTVGNLYVDSLNHYVPTDWVGGAFPTPSSGKLRIWVHPCPKMVLNNLTNGSGGVWFYNHPAGAPYNSYWHSGATPLNKTSFPRYTAYLWGELTSLKFNVLAQYGGSGTPILHWPAYGDNYTAWSANTASGVAVSPPFTVLINLKIPGLRQWTKLGGWTGAQTGDVLPTIPSGMWMTDASQFGTDIDITAASETVTALSMTIEAIMDQHVVQRTETPVGTRTLVCTFA